MGSILLVEDDTSLGKTLVDRLSQEGYQVEWATSCKDGLESLERFTPGLALVDVGLPDESGFHFSREARALSNSKLPIVFLTAMNSADYRLKGFELGAEDYIPKPFHLRELLLRIRRVFDAHSIGSEIKSGQVVINVDGRFVTLSDGETVKPVGRDFDILLFLVRNKNRVVSRAEIIEELWPKERQLRSARTVDNAILRLRSLFGAAGDLISSERGIGYRWLEH